MQTLKMLVTLAMVTTSCSVTPTKEDKETTQTQTDSSSLLNTEKQTIESEQCQPPIVETSDEVESEMEDSVAELSTSDVAFQLLEEKLPENGSCYGFAVGYYTLDFTIKRTVFDKARKKLIDCLFDVMRKCSAEGKKMTWFDKKGNPISKIPQFDDPRDVRRTIWNEKTTPIEWYYCYWEIEFKVEGKVDWTCKK